MRDPTLPTSMREMLVRWLILGLRYVSEKLSALPSLTQPTLLLYDTCVLSARDHRFLGYTSSWYFRVRLQLSCVCHMHTLACYLSSTKYPTSQHMINFTFEVQGCFAGNASCSNVYRRHKSSSPCFS